MRVLSIQSHTVHGYVGNRSATFPLQLLGFDVDVINSVQFSNHTGYPLFKGQVLNGEQLLELVEGLRHNSLHTYTHLLTGYIGSVTFLRAVEQTLEILRDVNPDIQYVCDPVMGDNGKLYVAPELVQVFRSEAIPLATMVTPNQFELETIVQTKITTFQDALSAISRLHSQGPRIVIVTSLEFPADPSHLVCIASRLTPQGSHPSEIVMIKIPKVKGNFTGTGDLMTALLLAWAHRLPTLAGALENAVATMQAVIARTIEWSEANPQRPIHGKEVCPEIRLIQSKSDIESPQVELQAEQIQEQI